MTNRAPSLRRVGFTLIEILIVVVILGILASVVIVSIATSTEEAGRSAFMQTGRVLVDAAMRYKFSTGEWPVDSSSGAVPTGMTGYFVVEQYLAGTPIGGVWDTEYADSGITSAIGVHFNGTGDTRDDAFMILIDQRMDDGNLSTGGFRKLASERYYFVLAD